MSVAQMGAVSGKESRRLRTHDVLFRPNDPDISRWFDPSRGPVTAGPMGNDDDGDDPNMSMSSSQAIRASGAASASPPRPAPADIAARYRAEADRLARASIDMSRAEVRRAEEEAKAAREMKVDPAALAAVRGMYEDEPAADLGIPSASFSMGEGFMESTPPFGASVGSLELPPPPPPLALPAASAAAAAAAAPAAGAMPVAAQVCMRQFMDFVLNILQSVQTPALAAAHLQRALGRWADAARRTYGQVFPIPCVPVLTEVIPGRPGVASELKRVPLGDSDEERQRFSALLIQQLQQARFWPSVRARAAIQSAEEAAQLHRSRFQLLINFIGGAVDIRSAAPESGVPLVVAKFQPAAIRTIANDVRRVMGASTRYSTKLPAVASVEPPAAGEHAVRPVNHTPLEFVLYAVAESDLLIDSEMPPDTNVTRRVRAHVQSIAPGANPIRFPSGNRVALILLDDSQRADVKESSQMATRLEFEGEPAAAAAAGAMPPPARSLLRNQLTLMSFEARASRPVRLQSPSPNPMFLIFISVGDNKEDEALQRLSRLVLGRVAPGLDEALSHIDAEELVGEIDLREEDELGAVWRSYSKQPEVFFPKPQTEWLIIPGRFWWMTAGDEANLTEGFERGFESYAAGKIGAAAAAAGGGGGGGGGGDMCRDLSFRSKANLRSEMDYLLLTLPRRLGVEVMRYSPAITLDPTGDANPSAVGDAKTAVQRATEIFGPPVSAKISIVAASFRHIEPCLARDGRIAPLRRILALTDMKLPGTTPISVVDELYDRLRVRLAYARSSVFEAFGGDGPGPSPMNKAPPMWLDAKRLETKEDKRAATQLAQCIFREQGGRLPIQRSGSFFGAGTAMTPPTVQPWLTHFYRAGSRGRPKGQVLVDILGWHDWARWIPHLSADGTALENSEPRLKVPSYMHHRQPYSTRDVAVLESYMSTCIEFATFLMTSATPFLRTTMDSRSSWLWKASVRRWLTDGFVAGLDVAPLVPAAVGGGAGGGAEIIQAASARVRVGLAREIARYILSIHAAEEAERKAKESLPKRVKKKKDTGAPKRKLASRAEPRSDEDEDEDEDEEPPAQIQRQEPPAAAAAAAAAEDEKKSTPPPEAMAPRPSPSVQELEDKLRRLPTETFGLSSNQPLPSDLQAIPIFSGVRTTQELIEFLRTKQAEQYTEAIRLAEAGRREPTTGGPHEGAMAVTTEFHDLMRAAQDRSMAWLPWARRVVRWMALHVAVWRASRLLGALAQGLSECMDGSRKALDAKEKKQIERIFGSIGIGWDYSRPGGSGIQLPAGDTIRLLSELARGHSIFNIIEMGNATALYLALLLRGGEFSWQEAWDLARSASLSITEYERAEIYKALWDFVPDPASVPADQIPKQ